MKIVVTGAAGFLGEQLATELLQDGSPLTCSALLLTDVCLPGARADPRVSRLALDLTAAGAAARLVAACGGVPALVFHLAAVVSGHAEQEFEVGMRVNLDATRALLEALRLAAVPGGEGAARFVFASTTAVCGGAAAAAADARPVSEEAAPTPQSSYGCAKAMCELLVEEYARRGWVDARSVRLPTVTVRGGAPNAAVTGFASGMLRDTLAGRRCAVPVPPDTALWVSSPRAVVAGLVRAGALPAAQWRGRRVLNLPGLRVTAREMAAALAAAGEAGAAAAQRLDWTPDPKITAMVVSFPSRFDCSRALELGFPVDDSFEQIVRDYMRIANLI